MSRCGKLLCLLPDRPCNIGINDRLIPLTRCRIIENQRSNSLPVHLTVRQKDAAAKDTLHRPQTGCALFHDLPRNRICIDDRKALCFQERADSRLAGTGLTGQPDEKACRIDMRHILSAESGSACF